MKKVLLLIMILVPLKAYAARGCCSHHGGVCGCSKYGKQICCDGSESPTCRCTPPKIYGCTDRNADNYNAEANENDGSCIYPVLGCMDSKANNYNPEATKDDASCEYDVLGCTDSSAVNYMEDATIDDGSCIYPEEEQDNIEKKTDNSNNNPLLTIIGTTMVVGGYATYNKYKKKNK